MNGDLKKALKIPQTFFFFYFFLIYDFFILQDGKDMTEERSPVDNNIVQLVQVCVCTKKWHSPPSDS